MLSARDLLDGEKAVQTALAAYCAASDSLLVFTEHAAGCGFADLTLKPDLSRYPMMRYAALIEVKYLKKKEKKPTAAAKAKLLAEANAQLEAYAASKKLVREWGLKPQRSLALIRLCVAFHGEKLLFIQEI